MCGCLTRWAFSVLVVVRFISSIVLSRESTTKASVLNLGLSLIVVVIAFSCASLVFLFFFALRYGFIYVFFGYLLFAFSSFHMCGLFAALMFVVEATGVETLLTYIYFAIITLATGAFVSADVTRYRNDSYYRLDML